MGKLFVLINQSFSGYLIVAKEMSNTLFTIFWQLKKQKGGVWCQDEWWYEIKQRKLLSKIIIRSSFNFNENHVFIEEEDNPSDKWL